MSATSPLAESHGTIAISAAQASDSWAFERLLSRLKLVSERERLVGDALEVLLHAWSPSSLSAWLASDDHLGFRRVITIGLPEEDQLPEVLPDVLADMFPTHHHPEAPLGNGLAPLALEVGPHEELPEVERTAVERLRVELVVTLPGPHAVQGLLLLGRRRDGRSYRDAEMPLLVELARQLGRRLATLPHGAGVATPADSRVKPPLQFIARLEEELARAERFKRMLTVLWVAVDPPVGLVSGEPNARDPGDHSDPSTVSARIENLVDAIGEWLAATLRVMDTIGKRSETAFVAVLPETSRVGAELLKTRLATLAGEELFGLSKPMRSKLRLRVGLAAYPEEGVSSRFLLLAAERDAGEHHLLMEAGGSAAASPKPLTVAEQNAIGSYSPVAASQRMREVLELAKRVAPSKLTVLVTGETGVGKERLAEYIHNNSDRCEKPEVRLNCGAIPETMIEAEFFGFERGSFTGAVRSTRGKFELADGGSLFLDEIGELSMAMQVKLLRVLDEQRFYRLGAAQPTQVDVRVIAITNRDLHQDVMTGRFREDLFYRLNVVTVKIPPLRERPEDIPPLVDRLIGEFCDRTSLPMKKLALEAYDLLYSYPWRGNVRELRNVIERSVVVSRGNYITGEDLIRAVPDLANAKTSLMRMPVRQALPTPRASAGREREQGVLDLIRRRPDIGLQEILKEVGASKSTGIRLVNELIARGQVVRRDRGKRSRYRLAEQMD